MEITLTTPSIVFSAISLLLLAHTNRYLGVGRLIRSLKKDQAAGYEHKELDKQLIALGKRLAIIRNMQATGISSMIAASITMLFVYLEYQTAARMAFVGSLLLVTLSMLLSLHEVLLSNNAIQYELDAIAKTNKSKSRR